MLNFYNGKSINGKHRQRTHSTKMVADELAENTPNALNLSAQIFCPYPNVWDFDEKRLHWASLVRVLTDIIFNATGRNLENFVESIISLLQ